MATLQLGVLDMAYTDNTGTPRRTTTGDVAEILEDRYHVMRSFSAMYEQKIANALADGMGQALQDRLNGRKAGNDPLHGAMQKIETLFRGFIFHGEMQKQISAFNIFGAPEKPLSAAAARGVNHRLKHPYAQKNKARVAFVDTGQFVASFRSMFKADRV